MPFNFTENYPKSYHLFTLQTACITVYSHCKQREYPDGKFVGMNPWTTHNSFF